MLSDGKVHLTRRSRARARACASFLHLFRIVALAGAGLLVPEASEAAWSLSDEQRRAYLEYYAPIIMKRSDEDSLDDFGCDWITNYDFDNDGDYSTNKLHWEDLYEFILTAEDPASYTGPHDFSRWYIGPTLYTALIEYMEGPDKQLVLLYHVYHAKEEWDIHDWERIEIRIRNVDGTPGGGQEVPAYVVITEHSEHKYREFGHSDLNFHTTPNGMHAMIWQAEWSFDFAFSMQELHFVEDDFAEIASEIAGNQDAEVEINGTSAKKNINYVFVPESDSDAVSFWQAETLTYPLAYALASRDNGQFEWDEVPRIRYELQDLADILPSHWNGQRCDENGANCTAPPECDGSFGENEHWQCDDKIRIRLSRAMRDESGRIVVPYGKQIFLRDSLDDDDSDGKGESQGYPKKHWFWGAYHFGHNGNFMTEARDDGTAGSDGVLRREANGLPDSHGDPNVSDYMWQHDYFAHDGEPADTIGLTPYLEPEVGGWLAGAWYEEENGGFDGRWVQLFPDPVELPEPGAFVSLAVGWGMLARWRGRGRKQRRSDWRQGEKDAPGVSSRRPSPSRCSPPPSRSAPTG